MSFAEAGKRAALIKTARRHGITVGELVAKQATEKYCPTCEAWLLHELFAKKPQRGDGLAGVCRECSRRKDRAAKAAKLATTEAKRARAAREAAQARERTAAVAVLEAPRLKTDDRAVRGRERAKLRRKACKIPPEPITNRVSERRRASQRARRARRAALLAGRKPADIVAEAQAAEAALLAWLTEEVVGG